ncbi:MAG: 50S ribosomal protein L25 [Candidatus Portnoybacteria bacterium]|nr:50S ribosomal protein L25 [Candidatus Portnoybacteria bacterium]
MDLELKAEKREDVGKKLEALRKQGIVPAVVYGSGHKPVSVQVNYEEFRKIFERAGESTLIKLKIDNEIKNVLIYDASKDPMSGKFIHIDFHQVRMDKMIKAEVALIFEGEAPAVKLLEGVLVKSMNHIEVEALPKDLPREIKIDISVLDVFDKHIRIKDLVLPPGVKTDIEPEETIVSVMPPRTEEEIKSTEEKPAEVVEPELVGADKEKETEDKEETKS